MQKLGRYDLIRVLGKGAMGLVYEGRDPHLDRRVAIKTIKVDNLTDEEAADYEVRFLTEARSVARLHHPHIVTVFDSDRDIDVAFLVMEFIEGEDLKRHLDRGDVYTLAQTLALMGDLLSALDYAHRQGVVHRDIKPANLLIEPSGRLKLMDFGVARMQDSADATRTQGSMVGTLKYMSPEQVQGRPIDARSDLFAGGVVLYQLLTSKRPFDGVSDFDVIQNISNHPPVLPSLITPGLPPALDAVVMKALEKSRDDRYATAQDFHTALLSAVQAVTDQTIAPLARPATRRNASASQGSGQPSFATTSEDSSASASTAASVVTQEVELVYWKDIKDSSEVEDFEEFLRKFPHGIYADLARRKLKRLGTFSNDTPSESSYDGTVVMPRGDAATRQDDATVPIASEQPESERQQSRTGVKRGTVAAFAGVAIVVLAAVTFFAARSPSSQPTLADIAPQAAAGQPLASASADVSAAMASAPTVVAVAPVPAPAASSVKPALTPTPSPGLAKAPVPAQPAKPKLLAAPDDAEPKPSPPKPVSAKSTQAPALDDPRTTCEGRWFISYQICMSQECSRPELSKLPICLERRAQERSNLERVNGN